LCVFRAPFSAFLKIHFLLCDDIAFWIFFQFGLLCSSGCGIYFFVLASLELIAEEIEDPFGSDENDLPTHKIAENIKKTCGRIAVKLPNSALKRF
jgi:putative membrane protein